MAWRVANSLIKLRDQLNASYPNRSKVSDGTIGDPSHQAEGSGSDHNPNKSDVVCAMDITHDPSNGVDIVALADILAGSKDPRIKYLIRNRQIMVPNDYGWRWVAYTGANPHTSHLHISVYGDYDNQADWNIGIKREKKMVEDNQVHFDTLSQVFYDMTGRKLSKQEFNVSCVNRPWDEVLRIFSSSSETKAWEQAAIAGKNNDSAKKLNKIKEIIQ